MWVLGITLGDVTGIGPEVTFKALRLLPDPTAAYVVIGDAARIEIEGRAAGWDGDFPRWPGRARAGPGLWQLPLEIEPLPKSLAPGAREASIGALEALRMGTELCLTGVLDGMVTGPVNKEAIIRTGIRFVGQTEFLTGLAGSPSTGMMLLGRDDQGRWLRVLLATTHLALREVPDAITRSSLGRIFQLADQAAMELGLGRRRIGVCGLNPHAGEGGCVGREEVEVIGPAVKEAGTGGMDISGPWAADTLFHQALRGEFEVVVAMYHDQGLGPLKLIAFNSGVNWTVGLPFVRTSPDHGTAYSLAGKGTANPGSMGAAINLALELLKRRAVASATGA